MSYVYHMDEGALKVPPGFRDATVNVLEWVGKNGRMALTILRELRVDGVPFENHVQAAVTRYPKLFTNYAEEEPMDIVLDVPAVSRRFRWRNETGVYYHHQVFLDLTDKVLAITAAGTAAGRDDVDELLHEALKNMQLRVRD